MGIALHRSPVPPDTLSKYWTTVCLMRCSISSSIASISSHNHWNVLRFRQHQSDRVDWSKELSQCAFPKVSQLQQLPQMRKVHTRCWAAKFAENKYFIPIWIELASWFITTLQEHSGVPSLLTKTIFNRRRKPDLHHARFKVFESTSCVACAFEGIVYVNLEALWLFLSRGKTPLQKTSSKILRYVLALSHKTRY